MAILLSSSSPTVCYSDWVCSFRASTDTHASILNRTEPNRVNAFHSQQQCQFVTIIIYKFSLNWVHWIWKRYHYYIDVNQRKSIAAAVAWNLWHSKQSNRNNNNKNMKTKSNMYERTDGWMDGCLGAFKMGPKIVAIKSIDFWLIFSSDFPFFDRTTLQKLKE